MKDITLKRRIERQMINASKFVENAHAFAELLEDKDLLRQIQAAEVSVKNVVKNIGDIKDVD